MSRAEIEGSIQELYIGILGRAADYYGLDYWAYGIENGTLSLEGTRASFATPKQPEYWDIYGGLSNDSLVDKVYKNFLERSPDAAGKAYWVSELNSGKIGADYFVNAVTNAVKDPSATDSQTLIDAKVLANKVQSAQYFTVKTKTADSKESSFKIQAKAAVDNVDEDVSTLTAAKAATDVYTFGMPADYTQYYDQAGQASDASNSILSPTAISLQTYVYGLLGLRYSATEKDTADYFTLTIPKTGILKFSEWGDPNVRASVIAGTTPLMNNSAAQDLGLGDGHVYYTGSAKVFAGEQVVIQLTGLVASGTDGLKYGFEFHMD